MLWCIGRTPCHCHSAEQRCAQGSRGDGNEHAELGCNEFGRYRESEERSRGVDGREVGYTGQ
jgi:hypothetical protein